MLKPAQLEEPARVTAWLKQYAAKADRRRAAVAQREGVEDARRNKWGGAVKGFGESALWFPDPHALINYADAMQRFLGPIRRIRTDLAAHLDSDLRRFESLYRSALASDAVLSVLSEHERRQVSVNADCIAAYRRDRSGPDTCAPLQRYGLPSN